MGRGQIELLAALFHADAPNDVAPGAYDEDETEGGLPAIPIDAARRGDRVPLGCVNARHTLWERWLERGRAAENS